MTQANLVELAKQGNPKAIAALINRQLQPKGITAKVSLKQDCLQVMLEAAQAPPKKICVDFLQKGLSALGLATAQKAKIYGRAAGNDIPDWVEEFDLGMRVSQNLNELAKQGDIEAISALVNQWIQAYKVTAKINLKKNILQVMLESTEVPDQQVMTELLKNNISALDIPSLELIKIFGKEIDEEFPEWHTETKLKLKPEEQSEQVHQSLPIEEKGSSASKLADEKIDITQLSSQTYETLKSCFDKPISTRIQAEEDDEKSIHEAVSDFIEGLENDLESVFEDSEDQLKVLLHSFSFQSHKNEANSLFSQISNSRLTNTRTAIRQLEKISQEVLETDFSEESLIATIGKSAVSGLLSSGNIVGAAVSGLDSFMNNDKQKQDKKLLLDRYEKAREKVNQEWKSVQQKTYELINQYIRETYNIHLINYQSFQHSESFCEQAVTYLSDKRFKEAIDACSRAVEINPNFAEAWNFRGCALFNLDLFEEALENFDRAININNKFSLAWRNKADSLQALGKDEEAIYAYNQAIEISSHDYSIWLSKSNSLCKIECYSEAMKACDIAITLEPENYEAWYTKASCAALSGDLDQTLENLRKVLSLDLKKCQEEIKSDPRFDSIRDDSRFKSLLEESSVGIDFSELKKLLLDKEWRKADQETARLMCETTRLAIVILLEGIEDPDELIEKIVDIDGIDTDKSLQQLDESTIKFLPHKDLNTIDKLWQEHSNGKFSFSVQKEIYKNLGGTSEFNGEIRDKFGDQVGWRVSNKDGNYSWRRSDRFEYAFEKAPKGHLPSCLWAGKEDGWFQSNRRDRLIALFAHIDSGSAENS